jgi:hypothetical protein
MLIWKPTIKQFDTSNLHTAGQEGVENRTTTQLPPNVSDGFETPSTPERNR